MNALKVVDLTMEDMDGLTGQEAENDSGCVGIFIHNDRNEERTFYFVWED